MQTDDGMMTTGDELGYDFHPRSYENAPGYPQLDIALHAHPTGQHFDPERVRLTIASPVPERGGIERLVIHHGWHGLNQYRVCAGRVILRDRKDKTVEAFTFGGDVQISPEEDLTTVSLTSPAPILELVYAHTPSIPLLLASEVEVLLAERSAAWARSAPVQFRQRLASAEPLTLYHACIAALRERFGHFPHREDDMTHQFVHFIEAEIRVLEEAGIDLQEIPALSDLL